MARLLENLMVLCCWLMTHTMLIMKVWRKQDQKNLHRCSTNSAVGMKNWMTEIDETGTLGTFAICWMLNCGLECCWDDISLVVLQDESKRVNFGCESWECVYYVGTNSR
jgi:hypothetical protein